MIKEIFLVQKNHLSTKRNYLERMINQKTKCMKVARKFEKNFWDGDRKYGYGGYNFIDGYWAPVAKNLIKTFKLDNSSSILDIGCGKGFLLYEIKKILPKIKVVGFDISKYAIKNSKKEIKNNLFVHDGRKKLPFKKKEFDLAISLGTLHNFTLNDLEITINEILRVSRKRYIMIESYRNNEELFNLQCWALTAESFLNPMEWKWLFKKFGYTGYIEFIYFK